MKSPEIKGECFGVSFSELPHKLADGSMYSNPQFVLWVEDDENWFEKNTSGTSVFWIDDLIKVLKQAKKRIKTDSNGRCYLKK